MRVRVLCPDEGVDLVRRQEFAEGTSGWIMFNADGAQQRWRARLPVSTRVIDCAFDPADGREIDAVFMRQVSADPHRRRHREERNPDALSFQVTRRIDAGFAIYINEAVAKHS